MKPIKLILLLVSLMAASPAFAVELKGQIKGTVLDVTGLAIPGAVVVADSPSLQGTTGDETDMNGSFRIQALPTGKYTVEVSKPNFQTWKQTGIHISPGKTITLDITLNVAEAGEVIVVEEEAPTVDVTSTRSGVNVTKEMMRDIPNAGRDYQSAMGMAPGVVGGGNPNVHGGFDNSNQYYVDGVNTTDPLTNTFSMNMNFDAIKEIQVITGGLDAEYGRSLGGAVNIVTRSGGNELKSDVQFLYSDNNLRVYKPLEGEEKDEQSYYNTSLAANVEGPILLDKLWYFFSLQGNYYDYTRTVPTDVNRPEPMEPRIWSSVYLYGKLTWKPTPNHQIVAHAQADPTQVLNSTQSVYTLPSGETWWRQGGWLGSLQHEWTPTGDTLVETQGFYSNSYIYAMPMQWRDCSEWDGYTCLDPWDDDQWYAYDPDGFSYGQEQYAYATKRQRATLKSSVVQYFNFLGEHEVKTGLEAEYLRSYSIFPGVEDGLEYWSYGDGSPSDLSAYEPYLLLKYDSDLEADLSGFLGSWFIQDKWNPIPRLTIRPGVRADLSRLYNDTDRMVFASLTVAPRLGAAFDVTGDGRTKVSAYYGRFYDAGYLEVADILVDNPGGYSYYYWDEETGDWDDEAALSVAPNFLQHDDLNNPYSDEFNLGMQRDLGEGWAVGVTGTYKKSHNFWEDDEVNLIWNADGTDVIGYRNGTNEAIYRFRTPEELYTDYRALEFLVTKQFVENFSMIGSYTWSRAYGTQDSQGATSFFDIPEQRQYEEGVLSYDLPHYVKLAGSYREDDAWDVGGRTSLGYLFGWDFMMRSGYRYRAVYYNTYWDGWNNWYDDGEIPDRLPALSQTDLKAGLTFNVGITKFDVTAECFNVFNSRTVTGVNTTYDDKDGDIYTDDDGDILYGSATSYQSPRYFQLGLRGEF